MPFWTFITNHGAVLAMIAQHGRITTRDIAAELGITERSVHRIISELEIEGYVVRTRDGRVNRYEVDRNLPLRRPEIRESAVGDLLKVLRVIPRGGAGSPLAGEAEGQGPLSR